MKNAQTGRNTMTTITIDRALLEKMLDFLLRSKSNELVAGHFLEKELRTALAAPDDIAAEMSAVADQYAHKLALDLECVLADYSGTWYDTAIGTLGAYREAMNAIHERQSPTFMGEPVIRPALAAPATAPEQPSWQDAPTVPGLWSNSVNWRVHKVLEETIGAYQDTNARWYGPIPQDGEKS